MDDYPDDMSDSDREAVAQNARVEAAHELAEEKSVDGEVVNVFTDAVTHENLPTGDPRPVHVPLTMVIDGVKQTVGSSTTVDGKAFDTNIADEWFPRILQELGNPVDDGSDPPFEIQYQPYREAMIVPKVKVLEDATLIELSVDSEPGPGGGQILDVTPVSKEPTFFEQKAVVDEIVAQANKPLEAKEEKKPKSWPLFLYLAGEIVEVGHALTIDDVHFTPVVEDQELAEVAGFDPRDPNWTYRLSDDDGSGEREVFAERSGVFEEPKNLANANKPVVVEMGVWDGGPEQLREYAGIFQAGPQALLGILAKLEEAMTSNDTSKIMPAYLAADELFKICATHLLEVAEGLELMAKESEN